MAISTTEVRRRFLFSSEWIGGVRGLSRRGLECAFPEVEQQFVPPTCICTAGADHGLFPSLPLKFIAELKVVTGEWRAVPVEVDVPGIRDTRGGQALAEHMIYYPTTSPMDREARGGIHLRLQRLTTLINTYQGDPWIACRRAFGLLKAVLLEEGVEPSWLSFRRNLSTQLLMLFRVFEGCYPDLNSAIASFLQFAEAEGVESAPQPWASGLVQVAKHLRARVDSVMNEPPSTENAWQLLALQNRLRFLDRVRAGAEDKWGRTEGEAEALLHAIDDVVGIVSPRVQALQDDIDIDAHRTRMLATERSEWQGRGSEGEGSGSVDFESEARLLDGLESWLPSTVP